MLQFWKKIAHNDKNDVVAQERQLKVNKESNENKLEPSRKRPLSSLEDEGLYDISDYESLKGRSKLLRTLQEILTDKGALNYFLQYMESRNASCYIHCWLDIDSLKSDLRETLISSPVPKIDHDSLSVSTDCDSYTADTSSICDLSLSETNAICDKDSDTANSSSISDHKKPGYPADAALTIFKRYIAQEATSPINCPDSLRNEVIERICVSECDCFDRIQDFVFETMDREHLDAFLGSDFYCKHQIDVLTSGNVVLDDILYNETALFYFMEFLELENARNLLEFWIAASNFQQQLLQQSFIDLVEAQSDAVVLYDKYFSLQAHNPLGFGDKVRIAIEQNICGENGLVKTCFHLPLMLVEMHLERNYLKTFLSSQLFYKYLSELINTVQSNGYSMSMENSKQSSDCSSERSYSTNSTFLALEIGNNNHGNVKKKDKMADMSIDTRELRDPDSLWRRKRSHVLSCGRVTSLGKFETDLEPEPDRKEFRLRNVVKKIVSFDEEDKKKEAMAWQVAEMIVKDITNITLNQHDGL